MQQHREFAGYGYYSSLLGVLASARSDLFTVAPEVGVLAVGTEDD
jgi:hypothetical protein